MPSGDRASRTIGPADRARGHARTLQPDERREPETTRDRHAWASGAWVVLPTYNERENLAGDRGRDPRGAARRDAARRRRQLARRHRRRSPTSSPRPTRGSGSATGPASRAWATRTSTGSASRSRAGRAIVIQMDADWSHDPAALPGPHRADHRRRARTSSSARATRRAAASRTGASSRRVISRGGSLFARIVLGLGPHDLTGGFKAWRASTLEARAVRRRPRRRLRVPDRDDVPRLAPRRPGRRGADHVPRPARRPVQDEPPDHLRGAVRGHAACAGTSSAAAGRCPGQ